MQDVGSSGAHTWEGGGGGVLHTRMAALKRFAPQCHILDPVLGDAPARHSSPAALSAQRCVWRAVKLL